MQDKIVIFWTTYLSLMSLRNSWMVPYVPVRAKKIQLILQFPQSILMKGVSSLIFNHDFWLDFSQTKSLQVSGQPFSCLSKSMALNTGNDDGLQIAWLSKYLSKTVFSSTTRTLTSIWKHCLLFISPNAFYIKILT